MTTWFTADLHLGHRNIIRYCDRPFGDVDTMNRTMVDMWNDTVEADDAVWVLGDFALGTIADTLPMAGLLNGHKILVAGNHDRCWAGHGHRADDWIDRYRGAGFAEIIQGSTRVDFGGVSVLVCHFPYRGDSQPTDRFVDHRPVDEGGWLLHGHVHERWAQNGRMINVGVDANEFRPVSTSEIEAWISAGPADRPTPVARPSARRSRGR